MIIISIVSDDCIGYRDALLRWSLVGKARFDIRDEHTP
jgi:hypothetical protein